MDRIDEERAQVAPEIAKEHEIRDGKLKKLKEMGIAPYAYRFDRTHEIGQLLAGFDVLLAEKAQVRVAGRLLSRREHGKTCFGHIADGTGKIQLYVRRDIVDAGTTDDGRRTTDDGRRMANFDLFLMMDIGDFVGVTGDLMITKTGERTVLVKDLTLLAKSMRPMPEKFHGLKDVEMRYRQRYADLIANPEVKGIFQARARMISFIRRFLDKRGYIEVETPVLQPLYGGAAAEPFKTHYESLEQDMFLRISDELYLKRLIVGGMDKVYEFAKDFRNEGLDRTHSPEFTQLELYEAYRDYHDMMALVEDLFRELAIELQGKTEITFQGQAIDLGQPWQRLEFVPALAAKLGADPLKMPVEELREQCKQHGIEAGEAATTGKLLDKLFSELIQDHLVAPTFVMNHPKITAPLAKSHRENPELLERFEPVICGMELGNAFSELNDPAEQARRLLDSAAQNEEHATFDEDYVTALEFGMPPCGGLGLGIDRMAMLFTDQASIREVILFPQLRLASSGRVV
jgi:lysyl-tRNA synthetase class 2